VWHGGAEPVVRSRIIVCALVAAAALATGTGWAAASPASALAAAAGVAATSSVAAPDIGGPAPGARLSAPAQRAALNALAGSRRPNAAAAGDQSVTVGTLTFNAYPFTVQTLPPGESTLYFAAAPVTPLIDTGLEDPAGVRMVTLGGQEFNHVSVQARYGLDNINAYRVTGDARYLTRAEVQAQRLIDRAVNVDGAWFHPYDFGWGSMQPPWYSALGQGYALSLFVRLFELTGDIAYRTAADATFASFLDAGPAATPWVAAVDPSGYLWLQEYPGSATAGVYNGFMVAALGIYDYYRVTGDPDALALFRGAATTVVDYAASYRRPAWRSLYCLGAPLTASPAYHETVVQQLLAFFTITGDTRFAAWADTFESDFPRRAVSGTATLTAGKHVVASYSDSGRLQRRVTLTAKKKLRLAVSSRARIHGRPGFWLRMAAGPFKGYWVRERAPKVFLSGEFDELSYSPSRTLTLPAGRRYTFHDYSPAGTPTATLVLATKQPATIPLDAQAIVDGLAQGHVAAGPYTGSWIVLAGCNLK
jgi:D-glucuronyl C5-epimerase C-terminus